MESSEFAEEIKLLEKRQTKTMGTDFQRVLSVVEVWESTAGMGAVFSRCKVTHFRGSMEQCWHDAWCPGRADGLGPSQEVCAD